jgi:hypothetical protein
MMLFHAKVGLVALRSRSPSQVFKLLALPPSLTLTTIVVRRLSERRLAWRRDYLEQLNIPEVSTLLLSIASLSHYLVRRLTNTIRAAFKRVSWPYSWMSISY